MKKRERGKRKHLKRIIGMLCVNLWAFLNKNNGSTLKIIIVSERRNY